MTIEVRAQDAFVEFVGTGNLSAIDIMKVSAEYHSRTPTRLALWNLLDAQISHFKARNFLTVAEKGAELARLRGEGARNAIVVGNEDERLLLHAYASTASAVSPVRHEVFLDRDAAIDWLLGD